MNKIKLYHRSFSKKPLFFNQADGFFIRPHDEEWDKDSPELLDISITNFCTNNCAYCYKDSDEKGKHIDVKGLENVLAQIKDRVPQIAFGGGNPNQHPQFAEILEMTRQKYDIVCNYTTNGKFLTDEIIKVSKGNCGAVAASWHNNLELLKNTIERLTSAGVKTNVHYVLYDDSVDLLHEWIKSKPAFLEKVNAIILLALKSKGRAASIIGHNPYSEKYKVLFNDIFSGKFITKIGFDSCSVPHIIKHITEKQMMMVDYCEGSRFSAYISENLKFSPCSFMAESEGVQLDENSNFLDIWRNHEVFVNFRSKLKNVDQCKNCSYNTNCRKCPLFDYDCLNYEA